MRAWQACKPLIAGRRRGQLFGVSRSGRGRCNAVVRWRCRSGFGSRPGSRPGSNIGNVGFWAVFLDEFAEDLGLSASVAFEKTVDVFDPVRVVVAKVSLKALLDCRLLVHGVRLGFQISKSCIPRCRRGVQILNANANYV